MYLRYVLSGRIQRDLFWIPFYGAFYRWNILSGMREPIGYTYRQLFGSKAGGVELFDLFTRNAATARRAVVVVVTVRYLGKVAET